MKLLLRSLFLLSILLTLGSNVIAQEIKVSGKVVDEFDQGLPGVNILVQGPVISGNSTDIDGSFTLEIAKGDVLTFSFIGYFDQEITYSGQAIINVKLVPDIEQLSEVVVIGYGTQKKSDLTGSTGLISSSDVDLQPVQRVENMLQGKVAGVVVSQNSGAPGTAAKVSIRGFTGNPVYVIDGFIDGDINTVNPNDIESISILKDASATAIYGSRGANGVILVTTKQGSKNDKLKIDLDYYHGISQLTRKLDLLDPASYMKVVNKKLKEGGASEIFTGDEINEAETIAGYGTDWQDEIFRVAHADNLNASMAKGWENTSVRFSLGARDDKGIVLNSAYKRFTSRLNIKSQLAQKTNLVFNASYAFENTHNLFQGGDRSDGESDVVAAATSWSPNLSVIDPLRDDYTGFQGYGTTVRRNPVYLAKEVNRDNNNNMFSTNLSVQQEILTDLKFKIFGAAQWKKGDGETFRRYEPATLGSTTKISRSDAESYKYQGNLQLDYVKDFGTDHNLNAIGVFEMISRKNESLGITTTFPINGDPEGVDSEPLLIIEPESMMSYLTRIGYSFKDKLLFTGSIRFDGSSRLPKDNQWESFLSGALAYRISDESFLMNSDLINNLKFRLGYGEIGNVNSIQAFQVQDLTDPNISGYVFDGYTLTYAEGIESGNKRANPYLKWERSRQWNGGIDLGLWGGRLAIVADYYIKYTDDSHFNEPVAKYLGGGSVKTNTGQVQNSGFEFQLISKFNNNKNFKITSNLNFSLNQSKVLNLPQDTVFVGNQNYGFDRQSHVLIPGQEVGQLWGYSYLGPKIEGAPVMEGEVPNVLPGAAIYKDLNGDNMITIADMEVIGNGHPDFTWGFNSYIDYKKFSLNLFIQGVHGVDVFNIPQHGLLGGGSGVLDATSTEILNSWSIDETGGLPSLTALYEPQSSLFVEDASFIRVKNITLAYEFTSEMLRKIKVSRFRIYMGVQNIATFSSYSGYDPESKSGGNLAPGMDKGSFPVPGTYTIGLNLGF